MIRFAATRAGAASAARPSASSEDEKESVEAQESRIRSTYEQALALQTSGKLDEAQRKYESVLAEPLVQASEARQSVAGRAGGRPARPLPQQVKYLTLKNVASIHEARSRPDEVLRCYISALEIDASDVLLWCRLAETARSLGLLNVARHALEAAVSRNAQHPLALPALAEVLFAIGDDEVARTAAAKIPERHAGRLTARVVDSALGSLYGAGGPPPVRRPPPAAADWLLLGSEEAAEAGEPEADPEAAAVAREARRLLDERRRLARAAPASPHAGPPARVEVPAATWEAFFSALTAALGAMAKRAEEGAGVLNAAVTLELRAAPEPPPPPEPPAAAAAAPEPAQPATSPALTPAPSPPPPPEPAKAEAAAESVGEEAAGEAAAAAAKEAGMKDPMEVDSEGAGAAAQAAAATQEARAAEGAAPVTATGEGEKGNVAEGAAAAEGTTPAAEAASAPAAAGEDGKDGDEKGGAAEGAAPAAAAEDGKAAAGEGKAGASEGAASTSGAGDGKAGAAEAAAPAAAGGEGKGGGTRQSQRKAEEKQRAAVASAVAGKAGAGVLPIDALLAPFLPASDKREAPEAAAEAAGARPAEKRREEAEGAGEDQLPPGALAAVEGMTCVEALWSSLAAFAGPAESHAAVARGELRLWPAGPAPPPAPRLLTRGLRAALLEAERAAGARVCDRLPAAAAVLLAELHVDAAADAKTGPPGAQGSAEEHLEQAARLLRASPAAVPEGADAAVLGARRAWLLARAAELRGGRWEEAAGAVEACGAALAALPAALGAEPAAEGLVLRRLLLSPGGPGELTGAAVRDGAERLRHLAAGALAEAACAAEQWEEAAGLLSPLLLGVDVAGRPAARERVEAGRGMPPDERERLSRLLLESCSRLGGAGRARAVQCILLMLASPPGGSAPAAAGPSAPPMSPAAAARAEGLLERLLAVLGEDGLPSPAVWRPRVVEPAAAAAARGPPAVPPALVSEAAYAVAALLAALQRVPSPAGEHRGAMAQAWIAFYHLWYAAGQPAPAGTPPALARLHLLSLAHKSAAAANACSAKQGALLRMAMCALMGDRARDVGGDSGSDEDAAKENEEEEGAPPSPKRQRGRKRRAAGEEEGAEEAGGEARAPETGDAMVEREAELAQCFACLYNERIELSPAVPSRLKEHAHGPGPRPALGEDAFWEGPEAERAAALLFDLVRPWAAVVYWRTKRPPKEILAALKMVMRAPAFRATAPAVRETRRSAILRYLDVKTEAGDAGLDIAPVDRSTIPYSDIYEQLFFLAAKCSRVDKKREGYAEVATAAIRLLVEDLAMNPERWQAWYLLGKRYRQLLEPLEGEPPAHKAARYRERAIRSFVMARRLRPNMASAHKWIGRLLYHKVREAGPQSPDRAELCTRAEASFTRAAELDPLHWLYPFMLGKIAQKLKRQPSEWLAHYYSAVELANQRGPTIEQAEAEIPYRLHASRLKLLVSGFSDLDLLDMYAFKKAEAGPGGLRPAATAAAIAEDCLAALRHSLEISEWTFKATYRIAWAMAQGGDPPGALRELSGLFRQDKGGKRAAHGPGEASAGSKREGAGGAGRQLFSWRIWRQTSRSTWVQSIRHGVRYLPLYCQLLLAAEDHGTLQAVLREGMKRNIAEAVAAALPAQIKVLEHLAGRLASGAAPAAAEDEGANPEGLLQKAVEAAAAAEALPGEHAHLPAARRLVAAFRRFVPALSPELPDDRLDAWFKERARAAAAKRRAPAPVPAPSPSPPAPPPAPPLPVPVHAYPPAPPLPAPAYTLPPVPPTYQIPLTSIPASALHPPAHAQPPPGAVPVSHAALAPYHIPPTSLLPPPQ